MSKLELINGTNNTLPILRDYQEEAVQALFDYFANPQNQGHDKDGNPKPANPLVCLPTGTGKSLVIAEFIRRAMMYYPQTRVIMATHVKTLIQQNANKMQEAWPLAPLGIYSAGLNKRQNFQPITFGGIQSMVGKFPIFGFRDLLIIDEAHLVGDDGSYLKFIEELLAKNKYLKVIGLSATPYRMGMGLLTNGPIFTDIVYDLCNIDGINRLIADGFLCPLISRPTETKLDVSNVGINKGEFNQTQLQRQVDKPDITYRALSEAYPHIMARNCVLVFASGIEHAEHISNMLNNTFGISSVYLHSKAGDSHNEAAYSAWTNGRVKVAVSMNMLTTGVDHPPVDLILDLQPTMSTGKYVQKDGRGTRPYSFLDPRQPARLRQAFQYIKSNCLVLDFADNIRRLGPFNDPMIPRQKGEGPPGDVPVKICREENTLKPDGGEHTWCGNYNHITAKYCVVCEAEFKFQEKLHAKASTADIMRSDQPQIETFTVKNVVLMPHVSKSGASGIKIAYYCFEQMRTFFEYKSVESLANAHKKKSRDWFRQRYHYKTPLQSVVKVNQKEDGSWDDVPNNDADVIDLSFKDQLRKPKAIKVWINKETPEILSYEF